ncbi:MAG TPA: GNAT family N-acetyltransferase [Solirubrobacteraceae bacterium]|nr:GNAT family N-acetyltransferase [Solirubrobacteraceae bacterium]
MNVRLREVEPGDLQAFYEQQADPVSVEMAAFPARDRDSHMAHWRRSLADETILARTVMAGDEVAGHVVSFLRGGVREVGYWIERELWGRGIASAALEQFLRIETRRPLHAGVAAHNAGSLRVLSKHGFAVASRDGDHVALRLD